jgi:hypothetical protein
MTMGARSIGIAVVALSLAAGTSSRAAMMTLGPVKDNTIWESVTGSLSNGAGQYMFAGVTGVSVATRGLLAFDVAGSVPAGSVVNSVSLMMNVSKSRDGSGTQPVQLRRVLTDWGEAGSIGAGLGEGQGGPAQTGDATWLNTFFPGSSWASAGGDFSGTTSASRDVTGVGSYTWGSTAQMVADVQDWLDNPANNFGWMLLTNETTVPTAKRFDSKDNLIPAVRSKLEIDFTVPEPGSMLILVAATAGLALRRQR